MHLCEIKFYIKLARLLHSLREYFLKTSDVAIDNDAD